MPINCETCQSEIASVEDAHSMLVVLQKVDTSCYSFYQCDGGIEVSGLTYQHWHCSHEEMLDGVRTCINEHYDESLLIPVSPREVRTHKVVLKAGLTCKVCGSPLTTVAYRFCLTHAEPVNSIPDDSMNELGEWCCSLEHAKQNTLRYIQ